MEDTWKKSVINDDDYNVILRIAKTGQFEHVADIAGCFRVIGILVVDVILTASHSPPPTRPP